MKLRRGEEGKLGRVTTILKEYNSENKIYQTYVRFSHSGDVTIILFWDVTFIFVRPIFSKILESLYKQSSKYYKSISIHFTCRSQ
jgi:hypothetical protein